MYMFLISAAPCRFLLVCFSWAASLTFMNDLAENVYTVLDFFAHLS